MITHSDRHTDQAQHALDLAVEIQGSTITVRGGDFVVSTIERTLAGDWTFDVAARAEVAFIRGYLAVDRGDGQVKVVVDETVGNERPMRFLDAPEFEFLERAFFATIPAGATLPADAQITVFRFLPPEE